MLTADNFVQSNSGGYDGNGSVTLPNPTTAGNRLIIVAGSGSALATPAGFVRDSPATASLTYIFSKPTVDGESSWVMNNASGGLEYDVFEVSGIDPDAPVDVIPTTQGSGGSTATTPQSTTYDGLWIGLHRVATTGAVPTFGAHTTGEELSDHGHLISGTTPIAISTCRKFVQSLGTWQCDCDPSAGSAIGTIVVYSAVGARREPTVSHFWSFPAEMAGLTSLNLGASSTTAYFAAQTGSPVILAGGGLRLTGSANIQNVSSNGYSPPTNGGGHVGQIKFQLDSLSGDLELASILDSLGKHLVIRYVSASQKIGVKVGTGTEVLSDATVTTGQIYSLDVRAFNVTIGDRRADWQLDYGSGPVVQTSATDTLATLGTMTLRLGWSTASTGQVTYFHALLSPYTGHYPLTKNWVFPFLKPDTAGTITSPNGTTDGLRRFTANGTIDASFNSANIIAALRDWPPTFGASASGAAIINGDAVRYRIPMETYNFTGLGSVRVVQVLAAFWAASATAATIQVAGWDGTNTMVLHFLGDPNADTSSTPPWLAKLWRPTAVPAGSAPWTQAVLDAAQIDILSDDATPDIGLHCAAMIAAVRLADPVMLFGATVDDPLNVRQDLDPDTQGILGLVATNLSGTDVTLSYEVNGVAQTPVALPDGTDGLSIPIDAPDMPTISRVELG